MSRFRIFMIALMPILISSCNMLDNRHQYKTNVSLLSLSPGEGQDLDNPDNPDNPDTVEAMKEFEVLTGQVDSIYDGYTLSEINGYKILFKPNQPDKLIIYYNNELLSEYDKNFVTLFKEGSGFPYSNNKSIYFDNTNNELNYTNGQTYFKDYGLDGIDAIYDIEAVGSKVGVIIGGGGLIPKTFYYQNQECAVMPPSQTKACCKIDGKYTLMQLGDAGWEKQQTNLGPKCEK